MDLENPSEPAAIKEDQAMVKDVKDDLLENLEKTPEPAATKEGQANDPDPSSDPPLGPSSDPSSGPSSESSSRSQKVEKKYSNYIVGEMLTVNYFRTIDNTTLQENWQLGSPPRASLPAFTETVSTTHSPPTSPMYEDYHEETPQPVLIRVGWSSALLLLCIVNS